MSNPSTTATELFPLFADLHARRVLVVGGGVVARRKIDELLAAGADVSVAAEALEPGLQRLVAARRVRHHQGTFRPEWLDGAWLVVAASGNPAIDRATAAAARARQLFVNVVDDATASSFYASARVRRGRLQVAISTGGAAPVLARDLRARIEAQLDASLAALTDWFARERARIRRRFPRAGERRRFYEGVLTGAVPQRLRAGDNAGAEAALARALEGETAAAQGHVTLLGAGPGDPGLLTLAGLRALQAADVIIHDRLSGAAVLDLARREAERIDVGKRVGEDHAATQARIHALLLHHARAGRQVLRLHGGDPLVFARLGEELDCLRAHTIAYTVIPGVTAASAAAAAAGIALTDRRHARSVAFISARGRTPLDYAALAASSQTLAIYMGVGELAPLSRALIAHGRSADTPCVLVASASLPDQRVLTGTLEALPALALAHGVQPPALLLVGEVAAQARCTAPAERCCGEARVIAVAA